MLAIVNAAHLLYNVNMETVFDDAKCGWCFRMHMISKQQRVANAAL